MSALTAMLEYLGQAARERGALTQVGDNFMSGAARAGTFQQGRALAQTPDGLAAQFGWSTPESLSPGQPNSILRYSNPNDTTQAAFSFPQSGSDLANLKARPGIAPHLGLLPPDANVSIYDTDPLGKVGGGGAGLGKRVYPTMWGNTLMDPQGYNIADELSADNIHRRNYNMASLIMRQPDAGQRVLTSPEQFTQLSPDVGQFRNMDPSTQVGNLQTEGALQALQRINSASQHVSPALAASLQALPRNLSSSMSPSDLDLAYRTLQSAKQHPAAALSLRTLGPTSLRKLGIVQDSLQGRPVDPGAFRGLEYRQGGAVTSPMR